MARELRQQSGVERLIVGQMAEADPGVYDRRPGRHARVVRIGAVHHPEVATGHPHIVRFACVGSRNVRRVDRVADDVFGRNVEEQRAGGADPGTLEHLDRQSREGAAGTELGQLHALGLTGIGGPEEDHAGRDDSPVLGIAAGGDDGLPEHLARLDHGSSLVAPRHRDEAEVRVVRGAHVHDVDQVRGVAPGGEALDGDIPGGVPRGFVRDLYPDPVLIEGHMAGQRGELRRRSEVRRELLGFHPADVRGGKIEDRQLTGCLGAQAGSGPGDQLIAQPRAGGVRVGLDPHARGGGAQLTRRRGEQRSPTECGHRPDEGRSRRR